MLAIYFLYMLQTHMSTPTTPEPGKELMCRTQPANYDTNHQVHSNDLLSEAMRGIIPSDIHEHNKELLVNGKTSSAEKLD